MESHEDDNKPVKILTLSAVTVELVENKSKHPILH